MVQRIIDIAVNTIRHAVYPDQAHVTADELQRTCHEMFERDLERIRHQYPPPVAEPSPRIQVTFSAGEISPNMMGRINPPIVSLMTTAEVVQRHAGQWLRMRYRPEHEPDQEHEKPESQARAKAMLWSYLNHQQREQLFLLNYFCVQGSRSKKVYRITNAGTGNVIREDGNTYCLVPDSPVPQWDQLLAQKLMLEDDERRFLKLAVPQNDRLQMDEFRAFAREVAEIYAGQLRLEPPEPPQPRDPPEPLGPR